MSDHLSERRKQSFKQHLLLNCLTNFDKTPQACSLGGTLSKSFKEINSLQNSGCDGISAHLSTKFEVSYFDCFSSVVYHFCLFTFSYKGLLLLNLAFKITSLECSLGGPMSNLFKERIPSRSLDAVVSEKGKIDKFLKIFLSKSTGPI